MTTTKNNEHKKLNFSSEREQSQACLNSAEHEKNQGRKVLNVPNKQEQNQTCLDSAEREGLRPKGNVPNLRFKEFEGEWEKCILGDITENFNLRNKDKIQYPMFSVTNDRGFVPQSEQFEGRDMVGEDIKAYKIIHTNDFAYNPARINVGSIAMYTGEKPCMISSLYVCFKTTKEVNNEWLMQLLKTPKMNYYYKVNGEGGVRVYLFYPNFARIRMSIPKIEEQKKIAKLLNLIDERIATQNKIIEDLKKLKSAIIEIEYTPNTKTTSHIGDVIEQISKRNKNNAIQNVLSVSNRQGFIKQSDQFENRNVASEDTSNYKIVEKNDFAFNPARINVGSIARLTTLEKGIVSPMYICFRTQENVAPEYIDFFFESKHFYCEIQKRLEGSVRQCLSFEGLCNIPISLPSLEMQQRIGKRLLTLGQKIKTETDLLELLNKQKQYLLRQMFI